MMNRKPGDWDCTSCTYLNFCSRHLCQLCGRPRPVASASMTTVLPGDWYCSCGIHNYASRTNCFKCGRSKDEAIASARLAWKSGDWLCSRPGCSEHNFASRTECFKCNAPRGWANQPYYTTF